MGNAVKVRKTEVPRKPGELARFKVVQGPDLGCTFVMTGPSVSVGRGTENDLILADPKASRKHAEIHYVGGAWSFKDAGSANGVLFKGKLVRSGQLRMGDTITVGETTLEFMTAEQGTQMLMAPAKTLEQVELDQRALEARRREIRGQAPLGLGPVATSSSGQPAAAGDQKKRILLYGGAAIALLVMVMGGGAPNTAGKKSGKSKAPRSDALREIASLTPLDDDNANRQVAQFFSLGYREYRERNFVRAKEHFETLLQMMPGNAKAIRYLILCDNGMIESVEKYLLSGERSFQIGRYQEADGHLQSAVRMLAKIQASTYIDAESREKFQKRSDDVKKRIEELQKRRSQLPGGRAR